MNELRRKKLLYGAAVQINRQPTAPTRSEAIT